MELARVDELAKSWNKDDDYSEFIRRKMPNSPVNKG